jgi:hypothetical protein
MLVVFISPKLYRIANKLSRSRVWPSRENVSCRYRTRAHTRDCGEGMKHDPAWVISQIFGALWEVVRSIGPCPYAFVRTWTFGSLADSIGVGSRHHRINIPKLGIGSLGRRSVQRCQETDAFGIRVTTKININTQVTIAFARNVAPPGRLVNIAFGIFFSLHSCKTGVRRWRHSLPPLRFLLQLVPISSVVIIHQTRDSTTIAPHESFRQSIRQERYDAWTSRQSEK